MAAFVVQGDGAGEAVLGAFEVAVPFGERRDIAEVANSPLRISRS